MPKLRKTIQRQIIDALDSSAFTSEDFKVFFGEPTNNEYLVSLVFIHNSNYFFNVEKREDPFSAHYILNKSPGQIEDIEQLNYSDLHDLIFAIAPWCQEVKSELKATMPIFREMDELRNTFYEHLNTHSSDEEFTVSEINKLREQFEELNKRVDELEKNNVITESQSQIFKSGVDKITDDLEYYPKETWLKTASNKIVKLIANLGKSPEGRKIIADSARKLIGLDP